METETPLIAKIIIAFVIVAAIIILYQFIKKPAKKSNHNRVDSARTNRDLTGRGHKK